MKTNQEYKTKVKGLEVTVPKGTSITHQTSLGIDPTYHFVNDFDWYKPELKGFARQMEIHDLVHYGINVPKEFVDK